MKNIGKAIAVFWVLFLLVHAWAFANDSTASQALSWSSCRIHAQGHGSQSKGSGAYLGHRWVISAAHVTDEDIDGRVGVQDRAGGMLGGKVIARDQISDMSLIRLDTEPQRLRPIRLAQADPQNGETVYQAGFGGSGRFRIMRGRVTYPNAGPNQRYGYVWFGQTGEARSGDSGGPVCNAKGELIGPLWGSGQGQTSSSKATITRGFLNQVSHRVPTPLRDGLRVLIGARPVNAWSMPPGFT